MLRPVNKNTVKAELRRGIPFIGYIAPNRVSRQHVNGGWHIGANVEFDTIETMEATLKLYAFYNCNAELGRTVRFWRAS